MTIHTLFCYRWVLVLLLNASFENQLASLGFNYQSERLVLSCLHNNKKIIVLTHSHTPSRLWRTALSTSVWSPLSTFAACYENVFKVVPMLSFTVLINKTQLLAWFVFQKLVSRAWISPWGDGERLENTLYFCWNSFKWVSWLCVCVGWRN